MNFNQILETYISYVVTLLEIMGILIILYAALKNFYKYIKTINKPDENKIKIDFAKSIALSLEFKLASEILKTVIIKNMDDLYILGAVVVIRVILTFVIQWEIKEDKEISDNEREKH